jgi:hypothetical protein
LCFVSKKTRRLCAMKPGWVRVPLLTMGRRTGAGEWQWLRLAARGGRWSLGLQTTGGRVWRVRQTPLGTYLEKTTT